MFVAGPAWGKDETTILQPSSKWIVNYGDSSCRMVRQFGEGDNQVYALFNRYGPGDAFQFTVAGKPIKKNLFAVQPVKVETQIQFGPDEGVKDVLGYEGTFADKPALVFGRHMSVEKRPDEPDYKFGETDEKPPEPPIPTERLAAVKWVMIGKTNGKKVRLETGAMDKPFAVLSACVDNLIASWGIDPVKDKNLLKRAKPLVSPAKWISPDDYPPNMLRSAQAAIVQVRLNVDAEGKTTACHIQETTKPKEFDDAVCRGLMKHARFSPAIDADGKPTATYWRNSVQFMIPD